MTRRILMLSSVPLAAPWNGADKNMARLLAHADPSNHFIVQTDRDEVWPSHVESIRERRTSAMPTRDQKLRAFAYLLRHTGAADLVHVVASLSNPSRWSAPLLRAWTALRRRPLIHTVPSIGDRPVQRHNFPGDVTVVVSEFTQRLLTSQGVPNVVRVYPPLDEQRPASDPAVLAQMHTLGPRAVLYPAHYGPESGIGEMIHAFAQLPPTLDDAVLVLACRTHPHQDPAQEAARVMATARQAGLAERVRVLGNVRDMPALIRACAVTALVPGKLASKMDLPLVVLEALALERPVITSNKPPISESLLGGGGFAVRYGDVSALAAALTQLLADPQLRSRLAVQGRAAVRQHCQPTHIIERYRQIYDRAILERHAKLA
jgi:glycosyltransferase involved in cell wall biosynthesis